MKKLFLIAIVTLASSTSFAQTKEMTPEERAEKKSEHMAKELGLSEEQKMKVEALFEGVHEKNQGIKENSSLTAEQKKEQMKANHEFVDQQLQTILTEDQYKKHQELKEQHRAKKMEHKKEMKHKEMHHKEMHHHEMKHSPEEKAE